jgi:hypothetical protein
MINDNPTLLEKNGVWYLQGIALKVGDQVKIKGISWKVLGFGEWYQPSQGSFLWIQNRWLGIRVYAPYLEEATHQDMGAR